MANLGTLTLDLIAKIGGFVEGMDKAGRSAQKFSKDTEKNFKDMQVSAIALGNTIGNFLTDAIKNAAAAFPALINGIDKFNDIKDATGASIEGISALDRVARETGTNIDAVESVLVKFNAALKEAKPDNDSGRLFAALNLDIAKLKAADPAEALRQTAVAFAQFESDGNKARGMQELFGKSIREAAPFLNDLAEKTSLVGKINAEAAQQAESFNKQLFALKADSTDAARAIALDLIPALSRLLSNFTELKKQGNLGVVIKDAAKDVFGLGNLTANAGEDINTFIRQRERLSKDLEFATKKGFATDGIKKDLQELNKLLEVSRTRQKTAVDQQFSGQDFGDAVSRRFNKPLAKLPDINAGPKAGKEDDPTKKLLENQLKDLDRAINAERELLADRNKFLDLYNTEGLLSISQYYTAQQTALDEATGKQVKAYDDQLAALKRYRDGLGVDKLTERADAQGKINDILDKQAKLQQQAGQTALEMGFKQQKSVKDYQDSLKDLAAQLLEMRGDLGGAAGIRFDLSNERRRQQFQSEGNSEAIKALDNLKQQTVAQADLNKLQQQFSLAQGDLQIAEERITIARERGTMGEIEGLRASGDARKKQYAIIQEQIAQFDRLQQSMTLTPEQQQQYERLRLQLDQLGASLDPLADKFDTLFSDKFSDAFGDFIQGTKSAKDALKSFGNAFASEIQRMAIKDLTKKAFGGEGGIGSLFSGLFGGSGGSGSSGGGIGSWFSSLFSGSGFATGGYTGSGSMFQPAGVVHKGEYVLSADATRRLGVSALDNINRGGSMGVGTVVNNFTVAGNATRETQNQIAAAAGRGVARGLARA